MKILFLLVSLLTVGCASTSSAEQVASFQDLATVVSSSPVYDTVYTQVPVNTQYTQQYCVQETKPHSSLNVGTAMGAIVGGLVGSQIGGGTGREVAIGVGAATGAVTGNNINRNSKQGVQCTYQQSPQQYRTVQQQMIVGYQTQVEYNGRYINIMLPQQLSIGQKVNVSVDVIVNQ